MRAFLSAWLPVLLGIAVIVLESTTEFGADHTSGPLRIVYEAIFGHVSNLRWLEIHHLLRKTGHFLGYGTIGLFWLRAWHLTFPNLSLRRASLLALAGTALIASCDELHQTYLPNRTGLFRDVILDCFGATILLAIASLWLSMRRAKVAEPAS